MRKLSHVLTIVSMAVCLATPITSLAASNQAHVGFTNTSGATYVNSTRYTTGGTGTDIGSKTLKYIPQNPAPSTLAALNSSSGIAAK